MNGPRALVLTGYGLNCDGETQYSLSLAGFQAERVHISQLIASREDRNKVNLQDYHLLALVGGFSWGDDHGAGVILAARLKYTLKEDLEAFISAGKLIIGICNGFQGMVNLGLLPGFAGEYGKRLVALIANDGGNFRDDWVWLRGNPNSPCVFTRGIENIELPVRHGEGKFYAPPDVLEQLVAGQQIALSYALPAGERAQGRFPDNPNGSLLDVAGLCDPSGRIFGLMPHPEAFHHWTNHPRWTLLNEVRRREKRSLENEEGQGLRIFRNAADYVRRNLVPKES
jgi:phosphoribosylformylglycinamidine synthase subunit PurQ / glutaminase